MAKNNWTYSLSYYEESVAAKIGFERQAPLMNMPDWNRNYAEGDIWETWQHMIAAASEIAAARMLGDAEFVPHVNTFHTVEDIPGKYEIRYSFTHKGDGPKYSLRYRSDLDDPNLIYILMVGGPEEKTRRTAENNYAAPPFRAIGWAYGHECHQQKYRAPFGKNYYRVPPSDLHEMSELPVVESVDA